MSTPNTPIPTGRGSAEAAVDIPLSAEQFRLWYLDRYEGAGAAYVLNCAWRIRGDIDVRRLDRALLRLVERHELLRAVVRPEADTAVLTVRPAPETVLSLEHPVGSPSGFWSEEEELDARCAHLAGSPMPLAAGPLFTAHLLQQDPETAILMLRVHHLIADGWSLGVLTRDLGAIYRADGVPAPELPALPYSAAEAAYALAEFKSRRGDSGGAAGEKYWREALHGAPDAIDLPYDFPHPSERSHAGGRFRRVLRTTLLEDLGRVAAERRTTLFSVLNAALCGFLGRLTDIEDVVVGVASTDRPDPRFEHVVGFFVNTLPIRLDLTGDPDLAELAARARNRFFAALRHRDIPFDRIVRAVQAQRVPGRTPVFQVLCTMENLSDSALTLPGAVAESYKADGAVSAFDLTVDFEQSADQLCLTLDYSSELFTAENAHRIAERFAAFLAHWAAHPDTPLSSVPMLDHDEEAALLDVPADAQSSIDGDVLDDIRTALLAEPERVVLRCGRRALTAAQLLAHVAHLSAAIAPVCGTGKRVGVMLPRGTDSVAVLLAALSAGVSYVPFDRGLPIERLRLMVTQAELCAVLWDDRVGPAPDLGVPVLLVSEDVEEPEEGVASAVPVAAAQNAEAYLMFTSGSSGTPKGVAVGRCSLTNLVRQSVRMFGVRRDDLMIASSTTTFDISLVELLVPLAAGAVCEVADDETNADVTLLASCVRRAGATMVQATPSVWRILVDQLDRRVRVAIATGEALPEDLKDRLLSVADEVYNCYGPTEATVWASAWRAGPGSVAVGSALANTELYVLDRWGRLMPPGSRGELYIGGVALAHGYVGQPELTAKAFVTRDLGRGPVRLYRTGDIASWRAGRVLQVHGRRDSQVKLRGYRIELEEIEGAILRYPATAQCAVVPIDRNGQTGLAAFVVMVDGEALDETPVRRFAGGILPGYMVPSRVFAVAAIPRLPSGKTDVRALTELLLAHLVEQDQAADRSSGQPSSAMEGEVASVFQTVLGRPPNLDASFFDQGGDSIGAARVVAALRQNSAVKDREVPLRLADFVAMPTVRAVARWIHDTADPESRPAGRAMS